MTHEAHGRGVWSEMTHYDDEAIGLGYTLATGRLYAGMSEFHAFAEDLLGHPILTHEFARDSTWDALRAAFESRVLTGPLLNASPESRSS